jgi:hypothetical protein
MEDRDYWSKLCRNLRQALNLTQIQMASGKGLTLSFQSLWQTF